MFDKEKYILQFGSLAGWPFLIAQELRNRGLKSKNIIRWYTDVGDLERNLSFDEFLTKPDANIFFKTKKIFDFMYEASRECSIIHYHGTNIFFRDVHHFFEGPLFKNSKTPMLITFGGSDARFSKIGNNLNPYYHKKNNLFHDLRIKMRYKSWSKNIKFCATTEEMIPHAEPYFEKVFIFRQPINTKKIFPQYPSKENNFPTILHTPTDIKTKGTKYVINAINNLKKKGLSFEFKLKRNMTQEETQNEISKCDIYIDELLGGGYGVTAIESMAHGKPTLTWIADYILERLPEDFPIVVVNKDTLENKLANLILDSSQRNSIGIKSRKFVEENHDLEIVTNELINIYNEISY